MISYICIIISLFIPIIAVGYAKFSIKDFDNSTPRECVTKFTDKGKRAHYAQQNFYETFPAFAVGVLAAHQLNAPICIIDILAILYVLARISYTVFYIKDIHKLRSLSWMVSFIAIISLFVVGMIQ